MALSRRLGGDSFARLRNHWRKCRCANRCVCCPFNPKGKLRRPVSRSTKLRQSTFRDAYLDTQRGQRHGIGLREIFIQRHEQEV